MGSLQRVYERAFSIIHNNERQYSRSKSLFAVQQLTDLCWLVMTHKILNKLYLGNLWITSFKKDPTVPNSLVGLARRFKFQSIVVSIPSKISLAQLQKFMVVLSGVFTKITFRVGKGLLQLNTFARNKHYKITTRTITLTTTYQRY